MKWKKIYKVLKEKYVYTIVFVLSLIMMIGAWYIGEIGPFGGRSLVVVDGVHQYLPFFSEYQEKLKSMDSMQYSFAVGMGNNFLSLWSYYLSSPFNLLIILFSKAQLPMALNIIISLKIIMGALCFAYFLKHSDAEKKQNAGMIIFSLFYAFSSFVIGYYWNLMWLDCVFVFPLVILGMDKMMNRNDSRMYILALLYSFVCNYYISFMICIFLVLWFFTFQFQNVKDFFMKGIRFAIASLTTAALSALVLIPAYKGIMTTASAEFELPEWEFYGSFADTLRSHLLCSEVMTNQIGDSGTNLSCGVLTILFCFMFFFIKKISWVKKIKYLLLLVMFVISFNNQLLNYIWHGFHNQYGIPNRFAFLYVFILIIMAYEVYKNRKEIKLPMVIVSYMISILFVIYAYYNADTVYDVKVYYATGGVLTLYLVVLALYCKLPEKWSNRVGYALVAFAVIEMAVNGWVGFGEVGSSDAEYYFGETETFDTLIDRVETADESLHRSDMLQPRMVDEATWYNMNSIGIFCSTVRGEMVNIMGDIGFYTAANEYLYFGATPVTNALFGVKYVYTRDGDYANADMDFYDKQDNVSVYKNAYTLPIGYMVNKEILDFDTGNSGPFTVLNELSGALTGIEPVFCSISGGMPTSTYGTNVEVTLTDEFNASYKNGSNSARADIIYTIPYDMDLYVNCTGGNVKKIALLIDGKEVACDRYQAQLFRVGEVKAGQIVTLQYILNDGTDLSGNLYFYPMEFREHQFQAFYDVLKNRGMNVESYSDTKIEGTISVAEDGVFMTSIPYDEGWTIYANGEKMESYVILDGFLGTELPTGEYTIKLVYRSPGLLLGFLLTLIGAASFVMISKAENNLARNNTGKKKGKYKKRNRR